MTQTSTTRRPARPTAPVLWWVPLTIGGYGNTEDAYVLAETGHDAQAAAVMAGQTLRPGAWATAGIPRRPQHVPAGRSVAVETPAPEGAKVWNFGPRAAERLATAVREKRAQVKVTEMSWYRATPSA